jgi:hypothetical protein
MCSADMSEINLAPQLVKLLCISTTICFEKQQQTADFTFLAFDREQLLCFSKEIFMLLYREPPPANYARKL